MTMARKLTQRDIDSAKPGSKEYTLGDSAVSGFGMRVRTTGAKTYIFTYRLSSSQKQYKYKIGTPGVLTLDEARREAKRIAAGVVLGNNPAATKAQGRSTNLAAVYLQFERATFARFSDGYQKAIRRAFTAEIIPKIGKASIATITRSDIRAITDRITAHGKPVAANDVHRIASSFFTWCVDREYLKVNPLSGANRPNRSSSRARYLEGSELSEIWRATESLGPVWRSVIRLLMATGQRRSEVLCAEWSEFNLGAKRWVLPPERTKNRSPHAVHLNPLALEIIQSIPRREGQRFLFESPCPRLWARLNHQSASGLSAAVDRWKVNVSVQNWRLHDLRRSVATHMAELRVGPHIIEVVLNHRSGFRSGVGAVYNRHHYQQEAAEALDLWSKALKAWIIEPPTLTCKSSYSDADAAEL